MDDITIGLAGPERVDELRDLWLALHHHHQRVAALQPLVADDEASWSRRRATYLAWLTADDEAFLAVATQAGQPVGYAMTRIDKGLDDTWDVGDSYAEVYTLSVAPHVRGRGVGSRLLDFVDAELVRRGIRGLAVAVMVGNTDAQRFYERRGLKPGEVLLYRLGPAPDL